MPFDMEFDDDLVQRRLQRLEQRYQRAQTALAGAQSQYGSLRGAAHTSAQQLHEAQLRVERARRDLDDIQFDLELAELKAGLGWPLRA